MVFLKIRILFLCLVLSSTHQANPPEDEIQVILKNGDENEPMVDESNSENDDESGKRVESFVERIMQSLHGFRDHVPSCRRLEGTVDYKVYSNALNWTFEPDRFRVTLFEDSMNKCKAIRDKLLFPSQPSTKEEEQFPLAYGFLVNGNNSMQIYFLLSAIYQPQNAYCIAIDAKSAELLKDDLEVLGNCFSNIYVIEAREVTWFEFSVVRGVMDCLRYLSNMAHPWKYYQYLTGIDLPLKTNLEMVRILKQLNNTPNIEVTHFEWNRMKQLTNKNTPLPIFKSSLSALLNRRGVDALMKSPLVAEQIMLMRNLSCPDESLWATFYGNQKVLPIPGSFDANEVINRIRESKRKTCHHDKRTRKRKEEKSRGSFLLDTYYISRYQVWSNSDGPLHFCHGEFVHGSCVFGIMDLRNLLTRPELVVHKLSSTTESAAFFCLYETVRRRATDAEQQRHFDASAYAQLPFVRMSVVGKKKKNLKDVDFYFESC